ncbi:centrosomal protein 97kDa, partial [Cichlidogyrus casuarinus]
MNSELRLNNQFISSLPQNDRLNNIITCNLSNNFFSNLSFAQFLPNLRILELSNNNVISLAGITSIPNLTWLNLSNNSIDDFSMVVHLPKLTHLDLSENQVTHLCNISCLGRLRTLLLHSNEITNLYNAVDFLPPSLEILALANNQIKAFKSIQILGQLPNLKQLSVQNNPCVTRLHLDYDFRGLMLRIFPKLIFLDGAAVKSEERSQSRASSASLIFTNNTETEPIELLSESQFIPINDQVFGLVEKGVQCPAHNKIAAEELRQLKFYLGQKRAHSSSVTSPRSYRSISNPSLPVRPKSSHVGCSSVENLPRRASPEEASCSERGTQFEDADLNSLESSCGTQLMSSLLSAIQTLESRQEDLQMSLNEERTLRKAQNEVLQSLTDQLKRVISTKRSSKRRKSSMKKLLDKTILRPNSLATIPKVITECWQSSSTDEEELTAKLVQDNPHMFQKDVLKPQQEPLTPLSADDSCAVDVSELDEVRVAALK